MVLLTMRTTNKPGFWGAACGAVLAILLTACSTIDTARAPAFAPNAQWALLPFVNNTETPQAGLRAEAIAESLMRAGTTVKLKRYPAGLNSETLFEPMDRKQVEAALEWARREGVRYALTGSVDEWRYKVGVDGEPAAGVALQVIDVQSGETVWAGAGGATGWSREALSAVAQKLLRRLLAPVMSATR